MERLSNRNLSEHQDPIIQFKYIETPGPVEVQYVDRDVTKEITSEPIILKQEVDLSQVNEKLANHAEHLAKQNQHILAVQAHTDRWYASICQELEMQRRALVGLKAQRDIDRSRRLMLLKRVKKEQNAHKKTELKLKLAMGASLILSILAITLR